VGVKTIPTGELEPNPHNPRMLFDRVPLKTLQESIARVGILVPLTVYWSKADKSWVILDGQRRWMCAKEVGLKTVPVNEVAEPTPVENIVTGPGQTSLAKGEFVVAFKIPKPKPRQAGAYLRFIPRTEMDIAVVGVAVDVTLDAGGTCTDARVVLGAVAPTQLVVNEAAQALIGHKLDADTLAKLDAAAQRACKPITDKRGTIEYRTKIAGVLARRAAAIAFERAAARA